MSPLLNEQMGPQWVAMLKLCSLSGGGTETRAGSAPQLLRAVTVRRGGGPDPTADVGVLTRL